MGGVRIRVRIRVRVYGFDHGWLILTLTLTLILPLTQLGFMGSTMDDIRESKDVTVCASL